MDRLNKKCFIASAGVHLLVGLVAFVGPAFTSSTSIVVPDLPLINFEPDILVDADIVGGGSPKAGRRPEPIVQPPAPQPQPQQQPPPPSEPKPQPQPEATEPPKPQPDPESFSTTERKQPRKIEISTKLETKKDPRKSPKSPDNQAQERQVADARWLASDVLKRAGETIRQGVGPATAIEEGSFGPGGGGPAYASYRAWVQKVYDTAWIAPDETTAEAAVARVRVVIAREGTIVRSEFVSRSGDSQVDASIQRALDRVTTIGKAFPEGAKEKERSYILRFDLKVKRGLA